MRSAAPLLALLFAAPAAAQGDAVKAYLAARAKGGPVPGTLVAPRPRWKPYDADGLPAGTYAPGRIVTNRGRAIVRLGDGGPWLWLEKSGDAWRVVGWRRGEPMSLDWLYQEGKPATSKMPEHATKAFITAIENNDPAAAEALCAHHAWSSGKWSLKTIFENTRKSEADLTRVGLSQRGSRTSIQLHISQRGVSKGEFFVFLQRRSGGWLIVGVSAKAEDHEKFLKGKAWPYYPDDPARLMKDFAAAHRARAPWLYDKLCLAIYRSSENGLGKIDGKPAEPGEVKVVANRASCAYGDVVLLMAKRRSGWRIVGHTSDPAVAGLYRRGKALPPR